MITSRPAHAFATGALGLSGAVATSYVPVNETIPFMQAVLWTADINGQIVGFTGQSVIAIISCMVGVIGIILGIIKLVRS